MNKKTIILAVVLLFAIIAGAAIITMNRNEGRPGQDQQTSHEVAVTRAETPGDGEPFGDSGREPTPDTGGAAGEAPAGAPADGHAASSNDPAALVRQALMFSKSPDTRKEAVETFHDAMRALTAEENLIPDGIDEFERQVYQIDDSKFNAIVEAAKAIAASDPELAFDSVNSDQVNSDLRNELMDTLSEPYIEMFLRNPQEFAREIAQLDQDNSDYVNWEIAEALYQQGQTEQGLALWESLGGAVEFNMPHALNVMQYTKVHKPGS